MGLGQAQKYRECPAQIGTVGNYDSIQLQNTLTEICGVQKQEKSIQTSNKKHFMKNVKECRDVIVKKVLEQGWDTRTTHYTHVGPMTPYIVV